MTPRKHVVADTAEEQKGVIVVLEFVSFNINIIFSIQIIHSKE